MSTLKLIPFAQPEPCDDDDSDSVAVELVKMTSVLRRFASYELAALRERLEAILRKRCEWSLTATLDT